MLKWSTLLTAAIGLLEAFAVPASALFADIKGARVRNAVEKMPAEKQTRPLSEIDEHLPEWVRILLDLVVQTKNAGGCDKDGS